MTAASHPDLIVVGGGPAGLAASIFAMQRGMRVTLLERKAFPLDKACGEGLMPGGVRLMQSMGVGLGDSRPFHGIRYIDRESGTVEARFSSGPGFGVRRHALSRAMLSRAVALGLMLRERTVVRSVSTERARVAVDVGRERLVAPFLIAADGLQSKIRASAGLDAPARRSVRRRYGVRRHYEIEPWSNFVEVHWARGAEAYVTPVGDREVGVALLWHERAPSYDAMLSRFPELADRLRGAPISSTVRGAGPFRRGARRVFKGRLALVGDAAGYIDAITGDGVALGIRSSREAVRAIADDSGFGGYERAFRKLRRRHVIVTETALMLASYPWLRRRVIGIFSRRPDLFRRLVAANATID